MKKKYKSVFTGNFYELLIEFHSFIFIEKGVCYLEYIDRDKGASVNTVNEISSPSQGLAPQKPFMD